jgi:putative DNA primase/helicase
MASISLRPNPIAPIVLYEGEKSVDAAARVFLNAVVITSPDGTGAASKVDWRPLAGRRVMIWPDADEPGEKYAAGVAAILHGQGCDVSIIDAVALAGMSPDGGSCDPVEGWDAADAVAEWQDITALRKAAHGLAKPYAGEARAQPEKPLSPACRPTERN